MVKAKNQPVPNPQQNRQEDRQVLSQQWSGPLPPPAALEHFNQIVNNGAERIFAMVELEQKHRINTEQQALDAMVRDTARGQWMGWVLSLLAIGGAIALAFNGAHPAIPVALVSLPVLGMIRAFLKAKPDSD